MKYKTNPNRRTYPSDSVKAIPDPSFYPAIGHIVSIVIVTLINNNNGMVFFWHTSDGNFRMIYAISNSN